MHKSWLVKQYARPVDLNLPVNFAGESKSLNTGYQSPFLYQYGSNNTICCLTKAGQAKIPSNPQSCPWPLPHPSPQLTAPVPILSGPTWPGSEWETSLLISPDPPPPPPFSLRTSAQLCQRSPCVTFFLLLSGQKMKRNDGKKKRNG